MKKLLSMGFEPARAESTSSGNWTGAARRHIRICTEFGGMKIVSKHWCSTVWTLTQSFRHLNSEKHCSNSDPAVTLYCLKHCPWQLCSKLGILPFLMITVWTLLYENSVLITVSTVLGHWIIYCYFSVLTVKNHCCMRIFKCAWAVFG